jgi:hypothetical protein
MHNQKNIRTIIANQTKTIDLEEIEGNNRNLKECGENSEGNIEIDDLKEERK